MLRINSGFKGQRLLILPFYLLDEMENNPLTSDLYIHSIGYYPHAEFHYGERPNGCNEYIFIYCVKGYGWYILNGKRFDIAPNRFFILPPNVPHSYGCDGDNPWTIYWIHLKGKKAPLLAGEFFQPTTIEFDNDSRIRERIALFDEIYNTLNAGYDTNNLIYASLCLGYFLGSLKYLKNFRKSKTTKNEYGKSFIHQVTHYMNENLNKEIRIDQLAMQLGYSPSYFYRLFMQATGYSPTQYLLHLRLQNARQLLVQSNYKISQVAAMTGFNDPYYFSRIFTKYGSCSPAAYRKRQKMAQSLITNNSIVENILEQISECVESGKINKDAPYPPQMKGQEGADELTLKALELGIAPSGILTNGLIAGMTKVGAKFRDNQVFVPHVLMSAKAMAASMNHLKKYFNDGSIKRKGKFIAGTVEGDLHDIGKNLVCMLVEGNGYEVIDLGIDVGADKYLEAIAQHPDAFVGMSALLTTTMVNMEKINKAIKNAYPGTVTFIGGAPVSSNFASQIGADYYTEDPQGVVDILNKLITYKS